MAMNRIRFPNLLKHIHSECRRVIRLLPMLPDGGLSAADAAFVEAHLAGCDACRREAQAFLGLGELLRQETAPDADLPTGAQAAAWILDRGDRTTGRRGDRAKALLSPRLLVPALAVLAGVAWLLFRPVAHSPRRPVAAWSVARIAGAPTVGADRIHSTGRLQVGQWLETDAASRARLSVADIGQVDVEPNTRIRLVETRPNEHRLHLARGAMEARVSAPPHLFFVETPSAVAVDMGCAYTLQVDDLGRSLLRVTLGWVAFVLNGRESIVPAGAACATRPGIGPGTPYFEDAPAALRKALARLDFEQGGAPALAVVLAEADLPDTLTLWHLLARVPEGLRGQVYDRLTELVTPPTGVSRDGVLRLDPGMLDRWKSAIEETW
jgi:predicted anti-sigma-YlaC factor YlaD